MDHGYRIDAPKRREPERSMRTTTEPGLIVMESGQTIDLAIPCYYSEVNPPVHAHPHDRMRHDMLGWPDPTHTDACCQEWDFDRHHCRRTPHLECCPPHCEHYVDMAKLSPIHLREEGYSNPVFVASKNFKYGTPMKSTEFREIEPDIDSSGFMMNIYAKARIDDDDDWIIRVRLFAGSEFSNPIENLMALGIPAFTYWSLLLKDDRSVTDMNDVLVAKGKLVVRPAEPGYKPE